MNPLLIALAILPALIICYAIYRVDKFDKESHWQLIICFVLGMLVTYPAMKLEEIGQIYGLEDSTNFWLLLVLSYIVVGLSEELTKFLALMFYAYPRKEFNEPLDGIVYAVMIAMGFATLENILYADQYGYSTTIIRAFTAVPAHAVFAVFMGYYVGLAKFNKPKRFSLIATGLFIAVFIHGTYDFFILQEYYDWLMGFATLTLTVSIYFSIRLIRLHQNNSPFKNTNDNIEITKKQPVDIEDAEIIDFTKISTENMDDTIADLMEMDSDEKDSKLEEEE